MSLTPGLPVSLGHSRRDGLLDGAPPSVDLLGFLKCGLYQLEASGDQIIPALLVSMARVDVRMVAIVRCPLPCKWVALAEWKQSFMRYVASLVRNETGTAGLVLLCSLMPGPGRRVW